MKHIGILLMMLFLFCSCRTIRQVQTEYIKEERTDTVFRDRTVRDSVFLLKEVNTYIKGDTVFTDRLVHHYSEKTKTDTVYLSADRILEKEVEKEVVREVNRLLWWQKALMWAGAVSLLASSGFLVWKIKKH